MIDTPLEVTPVYLKSRVSGKLSRHAESKPRSDIVFESLTERLGRTIQNLRGAGRLSEDNIQEALREVRRALLAADVALPVVTRFLENVRARAVGQEVLQGLRPGEAFIKVYRKS